MEDKKVTFTIATLLFVVAGLLFLVTLSSKAPGWVGAVAHALVAFGLALAVT